MDTEINWLACVDPAKAAGGCPYSRARRELAAEKQEALQETGPARGSLFGVDVSSTLCENSPGNPLGPHTSKGMPVRVQQQSRQAPKVPNAHQAAFLRLLFPDSQLSFHLGFP